MHIQVRQVFLVSLLWFAQRVGTSVSGQTGSETPPAASARFTDITASSGITFQHFSSHTSKKYLIETMGPGVALFDFDNDGRLDLFLVNGAPIADPSPKGTIPQKTDPRHWNRLYHQERDGTFKDVTEKAGVRGIGYGMGVAVGDYDNDGYEDFYVTAYGGNQLYHNNGDGTFTDVTAKAGVAGGGWSTSAAWVDLDGDGLLDLVVARYLQWDFEDIWCGEDKPGYRAYCHPDQFRPITPLVYHYDGNGHFTEISQKSNLSKPGKGLGIAIADYNRDGRIDVFIANDSVPEFLYENKGNGTFDEVGLISQAAVDADGSTFAGMGVDFADYNNDGLPDLVVTTLAYQRFALFKNNGDGTFSYASQNSGLGAMTFLHSGWGVKFIDYDNDGTKDLLAGRGHVMDTVEQNFPQLHYREPLLLTKNTGSNFVDVSADAGSVFSQAWAARGLAIGDIDNDGKLDAVVTTNDGPAYVLHNETSTQNHWLTLTLIGHKSNRDAIGAEVKIVTPGGQQLATVTTAGSYLSSSDKRVHFGLGNNATVKSIDIRWPSGIRQTLTNVQGDRTVDLEEPLSP
jgi:enediyne biosynthesis protein E4